jgi:hypothetical protein
MAEEEARCLMLYRCRFLDRATNAFQIQSLACENEAEAIVMARRMSANSGADGFELWKDERCVHIEAATGPVPAASLAHQARENKG